MHVRHRRPVTLLGVLALLLGLLVPGAAAQSPDCGPIMPVDQLTRGMRGEGLTVAQGTTPESFDVEVLGVLRNGIGVGRDMIIVEVSSPTIDRAGGIWQGMSGSPVYVDGQLIGAVAYGLAFASSGIGGLTPAEDMAELVGYPADAAFAAAEQGIARQVTVDGELGAEIRRRVGGTSPAFSQQGVSMRPLPLPLSVSGLSAERLRTVQDAAARNGLSVTATSGASADLRQVPTTSTPPRPGDNLAVAQSFGDLTFAAIGTATLVCDGNLVGFGHPFTFGGATTSGAATADAITIVPDDTFAPFKLANVDRLFGTLDQDRLAGVRAELGSIPARTPVRSTVSDTDLGRSRNGRTDVVSPDALPDIAAFHLLANIDSVIDRIGEGTSAIEYTVRGSGADSGDFAMTRQNRYASDFDVAFESIFELLSQVATLQQFTGEEVTIDAVDVDLDAMAQVLAYDIREVRAGVDGAPPAPVTDGELIVQPGSTVDIEVDLVGARDRTPVTVALSTVVPDDAYGSGSLIVSGGSPFGFFGPDCFFFPELCGSTDEQSLPELVTQLEDAPRNDQVVATIDVPLISDPGPPQPGPGGPTEGPTEVPIEGSAYADGPAYLQLGDGTTATSQLDRVVRGFFGIGVFVDSPFCPTCPPIFNRVAGEDRIGTAIATASYAFGFAETVVLAPADDYPAALVAGPLAASETAPVLLSDPSTLSPGVGEQMAAMGTTRVIIVAPDGQLGPDVEAQLRNAGVTTIERIGGADRYAVADGVARRLGGPRAWLVEGENADPARGWPDAVSAGVVAGYERSPILLTRSGDLPAATATTISDLGIVDVAIAGGTAAVSQAVADDLTGRGVAVERIAGADRYETSYLLAQRAIGYGGVPFNTWMVTGTDFPDALSAASAVVSTGGVMIMGDGQDITRSAGAVQYFTDLRYTAPLVTYVGGFAAISQMVEEQVFGILIGQDGAPPGGEEPPVGEEEAPAEGEEGPGAG